MAAILGTTSTLWRLVTGSAGDIEVTASWIDSPASVTSSSTFSPDGSTIANISTAATTTIVAAPGASTKRNIKNVTIFNNHATTSNLITVEQFDGTNADVLHKGTLLAGESLKFDETGYWTMYGADGVIKAQTLVNIQQLPAVPAAAMTAADTDTIKIFARKRAGGMQLKWISPSGQDERVQPFFSENGGNIYFPNNATTVGLALGGSWTSGGTVSHPSPTTTSPARYNATYRTRWANVVTTTNQFLGIRYGTARFWRGNVANVGGFKFHARFAVGLWPAATVRLFVGLTSVTSGMVVTDTLAGDCCGLWHATTDAASVLNFITRDNTTTTSVPITLGANLAAGKIFDFWMWAPPNGSVIGYALQDVQTDTVLVDTTTTSTLPRSTIFMGPELAMSNGTANITVTTTAFELAGYSCSSDY